MLNFTLFIFIITIYEVQGYFYLVHHEYFIYRYFITLNIIFNAYFLYPQKWVIY